jgi:hypothetical protein
VHHTLRKPACDLSKRSADKSTFISEAAQSAEGGNTADDPREALNTKKGDDHSNFLNSLHFNLG